jgi:hypothetical protein
MRYALVALAFTATAACAAACAAPSSDSVPSDSAPSEPASSDRARKPATPEVTPDPDPTPPSINVKPQVTTCGSLTPETGDFTQEWKASPAPSAAAGRIADGTFVLRTVTEHSSAADKPAVESSGPNVTTRFSADGTFEEVMPSDGDAYRTSGRWSIEGEYVVLNVTCSGAPGLNEGYTTRHRYSATANGISLYEDDANGVVRVSTFVRN